MTEEIVRKLTAELEAGITTEVQVVYVLAGIRKLLERDKRKNDFPSLTFHCDWVVHAHLSGNGAQRILQEFDDLLHLFPNQELPAKLEVEIDDITQMRRFRQELTAVLSAYNLPSLSAHGPKGWTKFLNLYARVIADIPLTVSAKKADQFRHVQRVVVKFDGDGAEGDGDGASFRVSWQIERRDGIPGGFYVIHKYDPNGDEPRGVFLLNA